MGWARQIHPSKESICSAASLRYQQNRRTRLEPSNTPVTLHAGKRLTIPHHSPLQFPIQSPWQIQGGGTDEWWLHSLLWAGTNLVARFCYWSGLRCTRHVITSSHVTPTQQLLTAAALTGCRDGATCALGEQIVLNPNWIVENKKGVTCLNAFAVLGDRLLPATPACQPPQVAAYRCSSNGTA